MAKSDLDIDILGTTIHISADEESAYLEKLLEKYRRTINNVQRVSGITDPLKTAVLTGFLLSDELEKTESAKNAGNPNDRELYSGEETAEAERLTLGMISRLEEVVGEDTQSLNNDFSLASLQEESKDGTLPFLFKVLAAAKPLSIQVHPKTVIETEVKSGMEKSKLFCALKPFAVLCGFREKQEILLLVEKIAQISDGALKENLENLCFALKGEGKEQQNNPAENFFTEDFTFEDFVSALFGMDARGLGQFMIKRQSLLERDYPEYSGEWKLCSYLANFNQNDACILAPLFMNIIELKTGEAMYIPRGIIHSYIHGMGIELMADSDSLLFEELGSRHLEREELLKVLCFSEYNPEILKAPDSSTTFFTYQEKYEEFSLSVLRSQGEGIFYSGMNPSVVFVSEGNAVITEDGESGTMNLKAGESAFVAAGKNLFFSGNFSAYAASCKSL